MIIYGHRGAKGEAPENTLPGFKHAYKHGIRHFEMDILLSANGEPVVIHDTTTDRTTGVEGKVGELTTEALSQLDARHNTVPWHQPCSIPTLRQVLDTCPDFAHMQFEVKTDERQRMNVLCNRLAELIQKNHWYDRAALTSSNTWFLREVKRRDHNIRTGLVFDKRFPNPVKNAKRLGCDYLCLNARLCSTAVVEAAHKEGLHVSVWTVNRIQDMLDLEKMGIDSIITDFPTSTLMYFENRAANAISRLPRRVEKDPETLAGTT
ncbi:glycerophosphodiester phosphodiesterase [Marinobacter nanhaiticus D15-8W]|uniref:Glycerophosphodiester phosphodiesterase n=1 Tax=Marinobacter nanhaiticus D15-8W TaxID=626887 RepID=N6W0D3_9GAMM|nr:glycerophosphodiester phosphodiesterase [Marinobacter nanhaiticus]ENO13579.1 glycerophosphodiester phosphodiesterase [Marinobacter nanhaiticus D15-8W]BES70950.1 glycerophosphodiester phosphodiesterase [Marinobacter nanhaiticus D15-8W]